MEQMAGQFHLYMHYIHHMDITPADRSETPTCIRKTCMVVQRNENEERKDGGEKHLIVLD
jgi:hypothetical protein